MARAANSFAGVEHITALQYTDMVAASYDRVLELQRRLVQHVRVCGRTHVILVEHDPPVITLGRRGTREHVLRQMESSCAARHAAAR